MKNERVGFVHELQHIFSWSILTDYFQVVYKTLFTGMWFMIILWMIHFQILQYNCFSNYRSYLRYISWEILSRVWITPRRLYLFHKVPSAKVQSYIFNIVPPMKQSSRHPNTFYSVSSTELSILKTFFPWMISEWNKLDHEILSSGI